MIRDESSGRWALAIYWAVSSLIVLGAANQAWNHVARDADRVPRLDVVFRFDALHYMDIAENGYRYSHSRRSNVAFFPGYPTVCFAVSKATGLSMRYSALIVANVFALGAAVLLWKYAKRDVKYQEADGDECTIDIQRRCDVVGAMLFFPMSFFLRMPYAESMFIFLAVTCFLGMRRKWSWWKVAAVVGISSAVRPVGVALVPIVMHYAVSQRGMSNRWRLVRLVIAALLSCAGLLVFAIYQQVAFGDGLAFVRTQDYWYVRPAVTITDKLLILLSGEWLWGVYDASCSCFWRRHSVDVWWLSCQWLNPLVFAFTAATVVHGKMRNILNWYEAGFSVGVLAIPVWTRAVEMCCNSHARFALVAFPAYIVWAEYIAKATTHVAIALYVSSGVLLGIYATQFCLGRSFF